MRSTVEDCVVAPLMVEQLSVKVVCWLMGLVATRALAHAVPVPSHVAENIPAGLELMPHTSPCERLRTSHDRVVVSPGCTRVVADESESKIGRAHV